MAACSPPISRALRTQPPADVSAMDGYAVRAADVAQAPATLELIGEVAAGHPFDGTVGAGEAARIFTGGVMPRRRRYGRHPGEHQPRGRRSCVVGEPHRRRAATSAPPGSISQPARVLLRHGPPPQRPRSRARRRHEPSRPCRCIGGRSVAVLATGDELVMPGAAPRARRRSSTPTASPPWRWRAAKAATSSISASRPTGCARPSPPCARAARPAPTSWSPPAAPRSATTIWCSRRSRAKGLTLVVLEDRHAARQADACMAGSAPCTCSACPAIRSRPMSARCCSWCR